MRRVEQPLVARVRMNGRHQAGFDSEAVVEDLRHRGQAVRGAGGIADDVVLPWIVSFAVDAKHDRDVFVLGRRRDDDLLGASLVDVDLRLVGVGEEARRFDDDVDPQVLPG